MANAQAIWLIGILTILVLIVTTVYGPIAAALVESSRPASATRDVAALPHRQRLVRRLPPADRLRDGGVHRRHLLGLWYPVVIALGTFVIGLIFVPETKERDIYSVGNQVKREGAADAAPSSRQGAPRSAAGAPFLLPPKKAPECCARVRPLLAQGRCRGRPLRGSRAARGRRLRPAPD